jgi:hypothetical protein
LDVPLGLGGPLGLDVPLGLGALIGLGDPPGEPRGLRGSSWAGAL